MKMRTNPTFALALILLAAGSLPAGAAPVAHPKLDRFAGVAGAEKVETRLLDFAVHSRAARADFVSQFSRIPSIHRGKAGIIVDVAAAEVTPELLDAIKAAGGTVLHASPRFRTVTVEVSNADTVLALAGNAGVRRIEPLYRPQVHKGAANSLADVAMNSDLGAAKYGIDGTGVKVGILSDSFAQTQGVRNDDDELGPVTQPGAGSSGTLQNAKNQLSGDLPLQVELLNDGAEGGSDEGAGMGELIHDIAPGAELFFHTGFISPASMADGIVALQEEGCKVIVDDIGWYGIPTFQPDVISQAVSFVASQGVSYFSSSGNSANVGFEFTYQDVQGGDSNATPADGSDLARWPTGSGYLPITVPAGGFFQAWITWSQPDTVTNGVVPGCEADIDAYLTLQPNAAGIAEAFSFEGTSQGRLSMNPQGRLGIPLGTPRENISYVNNTGSPKTLYLALDHFDGAKGTIPQGSAPMRINVQFFPVSEGVEIAGTGPGAAGGPTMRGHNTAPGAISVGAVNWYDTANFDPAYPPSAVSDPESFTAKGGTLTKYFDANGNFAPVTAFHPDIAAVDGNNTTFFGGTDFDVDGKPNFFGTSAAAPNAAAVAALMLDLNPSLTPGQVESILKATATDVVGERAAAGTDDVTGAGLVNGLAALDYVADQFGIDTGVASPNSRLYGFTSDAQGWVSESVPGFSSPGFASNGGVLTLTNNNPVNTLGWWKSPQFAAIPYDNQVGAVAINTGTETSNSVIRATAKIASSAPSSDLTPVFRLRNSSRNFEASSVLVVTSTGDSSFAPSTSSADRYRTYFTLPDNQNRFSFFADLLGFDSADPVGSGIRVDEVLFQGFDAGAFGPGTMEGLWLFGTGSGNWSKQSVSTLGGVGGGKTASGLTLGPVLNPSQTSFGWWGSGSNNVTLAAGKAYKVTFRVSSNATADNVGALPAVRLRVNDSSNQLGAYLNLESTGSALHLPADGVARDYSLYVETPADLVGNGLTFSFDYVFSPGAGQDPSATVTLHSVRVDSYNQPL